MSTDAPNVYREAQKHASSYLDALQAARVEIMHLIGYASIGEEVLYSKADAARMETHKQVLERLITDPAFNARTPQPPKQ